ncbi:DUF6509 family protein [Paenibacillus herberti]|uniref:Pullulanase n=1 Tax=Paenibacillus herberti TaxID=1619309 RepID=A0A229P2T3_9BACL|nr:DUF6509 family protein [Paenibacillus herberti]OXM16195.1 pullulanase [Paenibacillus herberti]
MEIKEFKVDKIKDPFGILSGQRYEFLLNVEVDEEDELFTPSGLYVRVVYAAAAEGSDSRIVTHEIRERGTDKVLDFELEEEELAEFAAFCSAHVAESDKK